MRYIISLSLIMTALWLALSGVYKPLILGLGAASIALSVWLAHRMDVVGAEHNPGMFSWRLPVYWGWLVWQIVVANVQVARLVLAPRVIGPRGIGPRVIKVPVPQSTDVGRATYANSVTLTPGTVSLILTPGELTVHALTRPAAEELESGAMAEKVRWLEGE